MDRGTWWTIVHGEIMDMTEHLTLSLHFTLIDQPSPALPCLGRASSQLAVAEFGGLNYRPPSASYSELNSLVRQPLARYTKA